MSNARASAEAPTFEEVISREGVTLDKEFPETNPLKKGYEQGISGQEIGDERYTSAEMNLAYVLGYVAGRTQVGDANIHAKETFTKTHLESLMERLGFKDEIRPLEQRALTTGYNDGFWGRDSEPQKFEWDDGENGGMIGYTVGFIAGRAQR